MPEEIGEGFTSGLTFVQGLETKNSSFFFNTLIEIGGKIFVVMLQWKTQRESLKALRRFIKV